METREITPEQIVMIIVFVAIPLGLIGLIVLFSLASCCGYQIAVISPKTSRLDDDTSSSSGTIGYKHEYDVHDDEYTDVTYRGRSGRRAPRAARNGTASGRSGGRNPVHECIYAPCSHAPCLSIYTQIYNSTADDVPHTRAKGTMAQARSNSIASDGGAPGWSAG